MTGPKPVVIPFHHRVNAATNTITIIDPTPREKINSLRKFRSTRAEFDTQGVRAEY